MVKDYTGMLPTYSVISQYKEMHIINPYKNSTREYCMQGRYQIRLCKDKNYPPLKITNEPKTGQSIVRTYRVLFKIHSALL